MELDSRFEVKDENLIDRRGMVVSLLLCMPNWGRFTINSSIDGVLKKNRYLIESHKGLSFIIKQINVYEFSWYLEEINIYYIYKLRLVDILIIGLKILIIINQMTFIS